MELVEKILGVLAGALAVWGGYLSLKASAQARADVLVLLEKEQQTNVGARSRKTSNLFRSATASLFLAIMALSGLLFLTWAVNSAIESLPKIDVEVGKTYRLTEHSSWLNIPKNYRAEFSVLTGQVGWLGHDRHRSCSKEKFSSIALNNDPFFVFACDGEATISVDSLTKVID